jgi:Ion channel
MSQNANPRALRRQFLAHLKVGLRVIWPILAFLLVLMVALGGMVALLEHWSLFDGIYFAFVSGMTIGYGDLAPKGTVARILAVSIGFVGILFAGLVAAVGVQALNATQQAGKDGST